MILKDAYFGYCCSLNHSYIYRQIMWQTSVLLITRRERKHHTTGKQYSCYNELQNKVWWYSMGADFNCSTSTTSYRPFMGLLYIKCYDHFRQTIYTRDSWSLFWCTPIQNLTISMYHWFFFFVFKPKAENLKQQQLIMGTSCMILCTGRYMWLMFLFQILFKAAHK